MKNLLKRPSAYEINIWGIVLLLIPFFSLLFASITFILGGTLGAWIFPTAITVSLITGHILFHKENNNIYTTVRCGIFTLLSLTFSLITTAVLYDVSYDGNTYHQGSIIQMLNGWNPFHSPETPQNLWIVHYAKGLEIVASTISICFNRIECGKSVNILLILSSILITASFIRRELPRLSLRKITLLTSLLSLCPVVIRQAYIYYNDYPLYTFMLLEVIALIEIYRNNRNHNAWIILIATSLFAAVTKFTVGFYIFLTLAIGIIWIFFTPKRRVSYTLAAISIILIIVGFGIMGYHPYITNTIDRGNPFYPLIGSNVDIMTNNTPELYSEGNRFSNLLRSLFYNGLGTDIWIPFATDSIRDYYIGYDSRIAGFGPFFVYTLMTSIVLWISIAGKKRHQTTTQSKQALFFGITAVLLIMGCFIFEQSWWARYVPFLWAVPVILLLYSEYNICLSGIQKTVRLFCYSLLLFTQILCCGSTILSGAQFTMRLGAIYHAITPQSKVEIQSGFAKSFNHKLHERNIDFKIIKDGDTPSDSTMIAFDIPPDAIIYLDAETASHIKRPDLMDYMKSKKEAIVMQTKQ